MAYSQHPIPGPGREGGERQRRQRGVNINQTWDFMSQITPMLNAMFSRQMQMSDIALESARRRPQMELQTYYDRREDRDLGLKRERQANREGRQDRQYELQQRGAADRAREGAATRESGIRTTAEGDVIPRMNTAYGGESPHQSEAQLAGWGVEGPGSSGNRSVYAPGEKVNQTVILGSGGGAGGAGGRYAAPPVPRTAAPGPAFGAMIGSSTLPPPEFEAAGIDKERKKKDEY